MLRVSIAWTEMSANRSRCFLVCLIVPGYALSIHLFGKYAKMLACGEFCITPIFNKPYTFALSHVPCLARCRKCLKPLITKCKTCNKFQFCCILIGNPPECLIRTATEPGRAVSPIHLHGNEVQKQA